MKRTTIKYKELVRQAFICENKLYKIGVWSKGIEGRFQFYIKSVNLLDQALKNGCIPEFLKENNQHGEIFFSLKQLYEFTTILNSVLPFLDTLLSTQKSELLQRLKISLSGPIFPEDENEKNNGPRNNLFELLILSRLLRAGYKNVKVSKNPDILINIDNRQYPVECKRVITLNERALFSALNVAIKQIVENWGKNYFKGIVAIDLSPIFEQGENMLDSKSPLSAETFMQYHLEQVFNSIYLRSEKLKKTNGEIIGVLLNVSCVYALVGSELGWMNELAMGVLNKESPKEGLIFENDLANLL